jgi:hypothetical protein
MWEGFPGTRFRRKQIISKPYNIWGWRIWVRKQLLYNGIVFA